MAYALQGLVSLAEGPRHTPIAVAASLGRLRDSTIRDHCAALVRPITTLWFWKGLQRKYALMDLGDIHRGGQAQWSWWYVTLRLPYCDPQWGGGLNGNAIHPWR